MTAEDILIDIDGRPALRFERRYQQPRDRVWRAVSDREQYRVTMWRKQLEPLHALDPRWTRRWRDELAAMLINPDDIALIPPVPADT